MFLDKALLKIEENKFAQTIRNGMVMALPVLLVGSIALMLMNLPIPIYQTFIHTFANGLLNVFFSYIYNGTFGLLSVYITLTISIGFIRQYTTNDVMVGAHLSSLICFFMFTGVFTENFDMTMLGAKGMFAALVASLGSTALYLLFSNKTKNIVKIFSDGSDTVFSNALSMLLPVSLTIICGALFNYLFIAVFHFTGFQNFFITIVNKLFLNLGRSFGTSFLFIFMVHFLWFFGIHGSDVLEGVSEHLFVPAINMNIVEIQAGLPPTEIFSKSFFDIFVLMGGSGATLCLLLAILLFCKRKSCKDLSKMAVLPMLFNINELMVFGLPIIFNPIFVIPFITVPLVMLCTSTLAFSSGWIEPVSRTVNWTTPVLLSGYLATNSYKGIILQLINLCLGTAIYTPFVIHYEKQKAKAIRKNMEGLTNLLKQSDSNNESITLTRGKTDLSVFANSLTAELTHALENKELKLYYQSQYDSTEKCIGVEALLRWNYPLCGTVYPPLVIQLASEAGILIELEKYIYERAFADVENIEKALGKDVKVSINVSGKTIQSKGFDLFLEKIMRTYNFKEKKIFIEITEQETLLFNDEVITMLEKLKKIGYGLAIDDFSMGHTSINYLKTNLFDLVKLDGSLVKDMMANDRCKEIIASIVYLSQSLGFSILCEYVETEEQRKTLEQLGCYEYQGYLFSPALPLENL